jgi:hypothetical protein
MLVLLYTIYFAYYFLDIKECEFWQRYQNHSKPPITPNENTKYSIIFMQLENKSYRWDYLELFCVFLDVLCTRWRKRHSIRDKVSSCISVTFLHWIQVANTMEPSYKCQMECILLSILWLWGQKCPHSQSSLRAAQKRTTACSSFSSPHTSGAMRLARHWWYVQITQKNHWSLGLDFFHGVEVLDYISGPEEIVIAHGTLPSQGTLPRPRTQEDGASSSLYFMHLPSTTEEPLATFWSWSSAQQFSPQGTVKNSLRALKGKLFTRCGPRDL